MLKVYFQSVFSTMLRSVLCWRDLGKEKNKRVIFFLTHELPVTAFWGGMVSIFVELYLPVRKQKRGRGS